ncbi:uncharacterized protein LOC131604787 [Vicia villosa]|uniref:uncharacterized protein LOC131604787 n=1 Tax=Vicia villosa TaxID=3911 RepID=UPI00273B9369|nr:uncharacterized protein LOC131604787 [Vicia villosa]
MQGMQGQQPPAPVPVPQAATGPDFRAFFIMDPLEFAGGLDPVVAHDWLASMERIFQEIQCNKEKVIFAMQKMKGPALRWWNTASTYFTTQEIPKDWHHFRAAFLEKYFPNSVRTQREREFQNFNLKRVQEERNQNRTNFREQGRSTQHLKPRSSPSMKKQGYGDHSNYPPQCDKCKRRHHGECKPFSVTCFKCGEPGHVIKNCPRKKAPKKTAGRVYTLDARKAKGNNNLIASTCYVNNQPLCVLVDCGATHSFISTECVCRVGLEVTP